MDARERRELVERYRSGTEAFMEAARAIPEAELDTRPSPEDWTAREIVHHFADAEMRSAIRLRQLIAEDAPVIQGYDESTYARTLHYDRPIGSSLDAALASRRATAELLERLTEEEWSRSGTHTEDGPYSVETWLQIYVAHAFDHVDQIRRARAGNP